MQIISKTSLINYPEPQIIIELCARKIDYEKIRIKQRKRYYGDSSINFFRGFDFILVTFFFILNYIMNRKMIKYIATIFLFILPLYLIKKFLELKITYLVIILFILSIASLNIKFVEYLSNYVGIISPVNFLIFATFLIFLFLILNLLKKINDLSNKIEDIVIKTKIDEVTKKIKEKINFATRFLNNYSNVKQ